MNGPLSNMKLLTLVFFLYISQVFSQETVEDEKKPENEQKKPIPVKGNPFFSLHAIIPSFTLPQIHLPQIHIPHISLPKLPPIKNPIKKETVYDTKTVYIEKIEKVTKHPMCVTAYGKVPPCNHGYNKEILEPEPQRVEINATPVPEVKESTINAVEVAESEADAEELDESEELEAEGRSIRQGRYLVPHPMQLSFQYDLKEEPEADVIIEPDERIVKGIFKATHHVTKTIMVTKVENFIDHQTTATLVAKNCIPVDPRIPPCGHDSHKELNENVDQEAQP